MKKSNFLCCLILILLFMLPGATKAESQQWSVPESKQVRVIIDSDAACEADDQAVIAYALLSPAIVVRGLVAAHFKPIPSLSVVPAADETMEASYEEMHALLEAMGLEDCFPVRHGAASPLVEETSPIESEGADLIIEEALREDPRPLYVVFQGPITDLAAAYLKNPEIAERLTAVWIGGAAYPEGGPEYNLMGDPVAANVVMKSPIPLWQIPAPVYMLPRFGMAEAAEKIGRQGKLGAFLFDRLRRFVSAFPPTAEAFQYADLPAVFVLLQQPWVGDFKMTPAPTLTRQGYYIHDGNNRPIRVYQSIDQRASLEDLFAKLAAFARGDSKPACSKE